MPGPKYKLSVKYLDKIKLAKYVCHSVMCKVNYAPGLFDVKTTLATILMCRFPQPDGEMQLRMWPPTRTNTFALSTGEP